LIVAAAMTFELTAGCGKSICICVRMGVLNCIPCCAVGWGSACWLND
jgi:hypothetical protein